MARRKSKINYSGSLADYKISMMVAMDDSQLLDGGGGMLLPGYAPSVGNTRGANIMPDVRGESNKYLSPKTPKPADRYPNPSRPPQKPADRYPDPLPPGRLPRKPVDRYPEATPAKPVTPKKPKKPKKPNTKGGKSGGGDSTTGAF